MIFKKGLIPLLSVTLVLLVTIVAFFLIQTNFYSSQTTLISNVEENNQVLQSSIDYLGIEGDEVFLKSRLSSINVTRVELNGVECPGLEGNYQEISSFNISSCKDLLNSNIAVLKIFTDTNVFHKTLQLTGNTPTQISEILFLEGDILTFQSQYSDLVIEDILINNTSVITKENTPEYTLYDFLDSNRYNTYSCTTQVIPDDNDDGIYTLSDLGFDFPFYNTTIVSGTSFYIDTNGRVSTTDSLSSYSPSDSIFINNTLISPLWNDLTLDGGMYVCSNQGTSPNRYTVIRFNSTWYGGEGNTDHELILFENGTIEINYGNLITDYGGTYIGISNGDSELYNYTTIFDESSLTNTTKIYSYDSGKIYLYQNQGINEINLSLLGLLDLTNTNQVFKVVSNYDNYTKSLDVGTLFDSCTLDSLTTTHLESNSFYQENTVNYPNVCTSIERKCYNGDYLGDSNYIYSTCEYNFSSFPSPTKFISTWNTSLIGGITSDTELKLPLRENGEYHFRVDWGDNNYDIITSWDQEETTHNYSSSGIYQVNITGDFLGFGVNLSNTETCADNLDDLDKLVDISQWGALELGNSGSYFCGAENFQISALDAPNLNSTTDMSYAFKDAIGFNSNISFWNVSNITTMEHMFRNAAAFNSSINSWDVSNVGDSSAMFFRATSFNQPLDNWDVSSVTDMSSMFSGATSFNQPLSLWDTSNVTSFSDIFRNTRDFNQPLDSWNVSRGRYFRNMFNRAIAFNQNLSSWDTSGAFDMRGMFYQASAFNGNISTWSFDNFFYGDLNAFFYQASSFNQPLNSWDVSSITDMSSMFSGADAFNQPLDNWDVSLVSNMHAMFWSADTFNQNISSWNVSLVTNCGIFNNGGGVLNISFYPNFSSC